MDHDQTEDEFTASTEPDSYDYHYETVRRSGATIVFWLLIGLLICLGICVLVSIVLALVYGS
ncbi:MAG: hypothetical protein WBW04_01650 [Nitrolancea sp.]